jgi:hypothetical protein
VSRASSSKFDVNDAFYFSANDNNYRNKVQQTAQASTTQIIFREKMAFNDKDNKP